MEQNLNNKIENALEEIRPFLRGDGGDIELVSVEKSNPNIREVHYTSRKTILDR